MEVDQLIQPYHSFGQMRLEKVDFYKKAADGADLDYVLVKAGDTLPPPHNQHPVSEGRVGFVVVGLRTEGLSEFHKQSKLLSEEAKQA